MEKSDVEFLLTLNKEELEFVIQKLPVEQAQTLIAVLEQVSEQAEMAEEEAAQAQHPQVKTRRVKIQQRRNGSERAGENMARRESMNLKKKRPNKFLAMDIAKQPNLDKKTDELLWKGRRPSPRERGSVEYEIECAVCNKTTILYDDRLVPKDGAVWKCNACTQAHVNYQDYGDD